MSLFRLVEWVSHVIPEASCITTANFFESRDQLIVGGENGQICVIDPSTKQKDTIVLTYQTNAPILQMECGLFLPAMQVTLLAVLSPQKMVYYRINYNPENESSVHMEEMFTHNLPVAAWNMCPVPQKEGALQLMVQTIDCRLTLFGESHSVIDPTPLNVIHPGPMKYCQQNATLVLSNNGILSGLKFSLLSGGQNKRINYDWTFNLGDAAIDMEIAEGSNPSIVVLCRRHVTCLNAAGRVKWQIRLESVGLSMTLYKTVLIADTHNIRMIVATADKTFTIYTDDKLVWNCNAELAAVSIKVCSFSRVYENVITAMSVDGRLVIGYLGTEPNLYKVPNDSKIVNFAERRKEFKEMEQRIKESEMASGITRKREGMRMELKVEEQGKRTIESNAANNVPYCSILVDIQDLQESSKLHLNILSQLSTPTNQLILAVQPSQTRVSTVIPFYIGTGGIPPNNTKVTISAHCFHTQASSIKSINLPLNVLFEESAVDKNGSYKITLDTDAPVIPIFTLFPEFQFENPHACGLVVHSTDINVTIFAANKSNRYRVQSRNQAYLQIICQELIDRVQKAVKGVQIGVMLPFEYIGSVIESIKELEEKKGEVSKKIDCRMKEVRAIEASSLNACKSGNMAKLPPLDALFDKSYRELLSFMDTHLLNTTSLNTKKSALSSLFQLSNDICQLNKVTTILNANFYGNTTQELLERLRWATKSDRGNEMSLIERLCENSNRDLKKIREEDEEETGKEEKKDEMEKVEERKEEAPSYIK